MKCFVLACRRRVVVTSFVCQTTPSIILFFRVAAFLWDDSNRSFYHEIKGILRSNLKGFRLKITTVVPIS